MGLTLLLPAALAALGALLLPLLIHLARRSEQRPTDFAALRWLRAKPKPRHRIRFDEWPLLLLRLLLLALLALWLARPVLQGAPDRTPYVAVMPGVAQTAIDAQALPENARRHWLAPGLPALDAPAPGTPQPVSSLLRQIDADLAAGVPLIVLATAQFDGADAQRPRLSRTVDWRIVDGAPPAVGPAGRPSAPPRLRIHADDRHASSVRYLRAAAIAWHADDDSNAARDTGFTLHGAGAGAALPDDAREVVAWLGTGPLPPALLRWIEAGGTALIDAGVAPPAGTTPVPLWRNAAGEASIEGAALGRGRWLRFARPLQPQAMPALLEADFPQRLRAVLQPDDVAPARADAAQHSPLPGARAQPPPPRDLQPWLALLIAAVFVVERWLATRRRRGAAP